MKHLSALILAAAVCLAAAPRLHSAEQKSQMAYWAPGVINRAEGSVEMDVQFLHPRPALLNAWQFLFRTTGNRFSAGTTILGAVLCPPTDTRDFTAIARGGKGGASIDVPTPAYELNRPYRVAISWGRGMFSLWFDGRLLGREPFPGDLSLLPEKFLAGMDSDSGFPSGYRIKRLRISDVALKGEAAEKTGPLEEDEHTTLVLGEDGSPVAAGPTVWQAKEFASAIFPVRSAGSLVTSVGKPLAQSLCMVNFTRAAGDFHLKIAIKDRSGAATAARDYTLSVPALTSYQPAAIALPEIGRSGYYQATLQVRDPAGREETYDLAFVVQPAENLQPGKLSEYMGNNWLPFSMLGYQWMRAWSSDRGFLWNVVEPAKGEFQWEAADRYVKSSQDEGVHVLGLLGYPPAWASTYSPAERDRLKGSPKRRYANSPGRYQPKNLEEWKDYVRAVVSRYHDRVKHWEIYNEVDFHPPGLHASFSGTTDDYLELLKSAYEIIKEIDPSNQVLTSGFSLSKGVTDINMPADLIKAGGAAYFDIFNVHGYAARENIAENVKLARDAKPGVPVWQTEHTYMGGPMDDYLVVTKCFWALSQGFDKYFLMGGEMDRNFGELYPMPLFGVTAELGRQFRTCDEYLGPVEGDLNGLQSWKLKRSDGSFLQVFAVDNGTAHLTFEKMDSAPDVAVTDLYGATLFHGKLEPGKPLDLSGLSYVSSPAELKVASCRRDYANAINNPGFEIRDGDYQMDESLARPAHWNLRPEGSPPKLMGFAPGRTGKFALNLKTPPALNRIQASQDVALGTAGKWNLSATMKAPPGTKMFLLLKTYKGGQWIDLASAQVTATGDWQKVSAPMTASASETSGVVQVGLLAANSEMAIDDVELIHLPDEKAH